MQARKLQTSGGILLLTPLYYSGAKDNSNFDKKNMPLYYHPELGANARTLRQHMTEAEQCIWRCLRRKQLLNVQFYRQRPIGCYVVDFYAPSIKLVIEIDGSQHLEKPHVKYDKNRTFFLERQGLKVLRFNNFDVLKNTRDVLDHIFQVMQQEMLNKIPPLV